MVHERYDRLESILGSLNHKTRGLLLHERHEFLAAYKAHTYVVQSELAELRSRVDEEKSSRQREEKLAQLKADCDWFRSESIRLDDTTLDLRAQLRRLSERLEIAQNDRSWLLQELKRLKTRSYAIRFGKSHRDDTCETIDADVQHGLLCPAKGPQSQASRQEGLRYSLRKTKLQINTSRSLLSPWYFFTINSSDDLGITLRIGLKTIIANVLDTHVSAGENESRFCRVANFCLSRGELLTIIGRFSTAL
mmetsp:Transcript_10807/g.27512  ORF Transcript_10807/g.27512 Transcript_10807/m.27512 type:complete len:250 (-) Transcript_10807:208-957(-)